ncbi:MAG: iron ABC transporter permease [Chloroflexi bacterium]|nr:iron ABC transporter permease [Chloroflexota bacterium]
MGQFASLAAGERAKRVAVSWEKAAGVVAALAVIYLIGGPLFMLLFSSVRSTRERLPFEATSFTLENFQRVFGSTASYQLFTNTLLFAAGTVALSLAVAVGFAYLIERTNIPFRTLVLTLVLAPMALPPFVSGIAWVLLANPVNGYLNVTLRTALGLSGEGPLNVYSIPGMILVSAVIFVPSLFIMISGTFARMDQTLEEAAWLSGAGTWRTLRRITLPLLRPGIYGAAIYYLIIAVELFEIPALLGMPADVYVLSTWIYYLVHKQGGLPDYGLAAGYAMLTVILASVMTIFYGRMIGRQDRFATVTGRGYRPRLIDLGRWRLVVFSGVAVYFLFAVLVPFVAVILKSILPPYADISLPSLAVANLNQYVKLLTNSYMQAAARNTAIIAVTTATGTMILATLVAWLSVRSGFRGRTLPDRLAFVSTGTPAIVVGLAIMFLYLSAPVPIYGTIWIIAIGMATRYIAYGSRVMSTAYLQLHRELEEASWTSGVSWLRTLAGIVAPLIWPSFARGWLWMFAHSIRDVGIPLMLVSVGNETIAVRLWLTWFFSADLPYASAIAVVLMLASAALTFLVARQTLVVRDTGR